MKRVSETGVHGRTCLVGPADKGCLIGMSKLPAVRYRLSAFAVCDKLANSPYTFAL